MLFVSGIQATPPLQPRRLCCLQRKLQPDPPANLVVSAIPGRPRWLRVSWQDPESWDPSYYLLQFELRYRPVWSKTFTVWPLQVAQHQCVIHDALRGVKHVVQVRGKEEFDIGQWSEWSPEVTGTPWLEPRTTPAGILGNPTQVFVEDYDNHEDQYGSSTEATSVLGKHWCLGVPLACRKALEWTLS